MSKLRLIFLITIVALQSACSGGGSTSDDIESTNATDTTDTTDTCDEPLTSLSGAYLEFDLATNVKAVLSANGCTVAFESAGKPDHTSSYWDSANASGLYVDPVDAALFDAQRSPGDIEDYTNDYDLTVSVNPELATISSSTSLGAIGIAVSGGPLFNDSEGTGDLSLGVMQGFDRNGAHTGPETYHYHLEPTAISDNNENLVGIIADGFFIYGRKCYSTSNYPTDLDESNGHTSITQHTGAADADAEYHYHVSNEQYLGGDYYLVFPGNYQGTASAIN
jgi:hypothetical protein